MKSYRPSRSSLPASGTGAAAIVTPGAGQPLISYPSNATGYPQVTLAQSVGLIALCLFFLASVASDITLQVLKTKTYLSWVSYPLLIPAFAFSGRMLRGLQFKTGKCWLIFLLFAVLGTPLSYWPHASFDLMWSYFIRAHVLFFLICAFVDDYTQCRRLIYANIIAAVMVLFSCVFLGGRTTDGRFIVPGSYLFNNANDLALSLLFGIGYFIYLVQKPGILWRVAGGAGAAASFVYMLRTASRGGLVAFVVFLTVLIIFSRRSLVLIAVTVPFLLLSLFFMPPTTLHRLTLIFLKPTAYRVQSEQDISSIESQIERQALMRKAVYYSFRHPLFGVGAGQFTNAVWADEHRIGKHPAALGTHNTYLEISSECGLPAFFCYLTVVLGCITINYNTLRHARQHRELADIERLSYALLATGAGFAVSIFFHHIGYSGALPLLAGITVCLSSIVDRSIPAGPILETANLAAPGRRPFRAVTGQG